MKNTNKKYIRDLAFICQEFGMEEVVFSPGSRLAPIILAFQNLPKINSRVVVDERVAGFVALGIAQQTRKPVAIVCTSGTAALNYAPAIAEAYYQRLSLIVITADRPEEWIDQADMQSIRQGNLYANYIRKSVSLKRNSGAENDDQNWYNQRLVCEALNSAIMPELGPVHINVPLQEPLYEVHKKKKERLPKIFKHMKVRRKIEDCDLKEMKDYWSITNKKLILVGVHHPDSILNDLLKEVAKDPSVVIMGESCSNLKGDFYFENIDRIVEVLFSQFQEALQPDLIITLGGMIVSKKIKQFFRKFPVKQHWHVRENGEPADTFQVLNRVIPMSSIEFAHEIANFPKSEDSEFQETIAALDSNNYLSHLDYLRQVPYCDLSVYAEIFSYLPHGGNLQLGNSTPVRYANLFPLYDMDLTINANRGVGGIDGTTSTAIGAASVNTEMTTLITGDLAFFYDSNGLWQEQLPDNLRIILINNGGGNIFRIIPGPEKTGILEKFFEAKHEMSGKAYAKMFELKYSSASNEADLKDHLKSFWKNSKQPKLLEVFTDGEISAEVLRQYFDHIKKDFEPMAKQFRSLLQSN